MKSIQALILAGTMGMGLAFAATEAPKPAVMDAASGSKTSTVTDIDYKARKITLKGEDGNAATMTVGPEVKRFNEIKKGDRIKIDYLASVTVVVQSPDDNVSSVEGSNSVIVRNKGKRPSATKMDSDVITATVEKIDAKKRTASLKSPDGETMDVNFSPDVEHLENVKKGDQLVIKVTRTMAIEVLSPKK